MPIFLRQRSILLPLLAFLLASALTALIYWSGLHGGFFFDDRTSILYARGIVWIACR